MKKLLKLLSILTITTPLSLNVIACGGDGNSSNIGTRYNLSNGVKITNISRLAVVDSNVATNSELQASFASSILADIRNSSNNNMIVASDFLVEFTKNPQSPIIDDTNSTLDATVKRGVMIKIIAKSQKLDFETFWLQRYVSSATKI
ncbi:hypothetical protein [Spiroplasma endosymbiont of Nebria brevicollis]|uniref:hypothetical protein n=1 Tax=Spiroplasma endosymbiont of Nebria brevicollis TaxID=3066284 RepID=UPI00313DEF0C